MSDELVTVVIPAFNCESTIGAAVASCIDQSYPHVEVVVVNDGSTDSTRNVLRGFGDRIRVIDQVNQGLAAARNVGHRAANGEFIAWFDGDDIARSDRLRKQIDSLRKVPGADLISSNFSAFRDPREDFDSSHIDAYYGALQRLGGIDTVYPNKMRIEFDGIDGSSTLFWGVAYDGMLAGNFVHPPTVLLRRGLLQRVGEFDCELRYSSDYDLLLRASRVTQFAYIDAPLIRYRRHQGQMSHAAKSGKLQLETVRILQKAIAGDSGLEARRGGDLRRFRAEALLSAAQALARTDRIEAVRLVCAAQRHCFSPASSIRAIARIAAPSFMVDTVKRLRNMQNSTIAGVGWCDAMDFETLMSVIQAAAHGFAG